MPAPRRQNAAGAVRPPRISRRAAAPAPGVRPRRERVAKPRATVPRSARNPGNSHGSDRKRYPTKYRAAVPARNARVPLREQSIDGHTALRTLCVPAPLLRRRRPLRETPRRNRNYFGATIAIAEHIPNAPNALSIAQATRRCEQPPRRDPAVESRPPDSSRTGCGREQVAGLAGLRILPPHYRPDRAAAAAPPLDALMQRVAQPWRQRAAIEPRPLRHRRRRAETHLQALPAGASPAIRPVTPPTISAAPKGRQRTPAAPGGVG